MSAQFKFCLFFTFAALLNLALVSLDSVLLVKQGETLYEAVRQMDIPVYNIIALNQ